MMYLEEFAGKAFDGLIITSRANHLAVLLPYQKYGSIVFCEEIKEKKASSVFIDRKQSIEEALFFLHAQGVKRLGVTLGRSSRLSYNSKITLELCKKVFPDFEKQHIYWDCIGYEHGLKAGTFFEEQAVDGVLTNSDTVAAGILQRAFLESTKRLVGRDNLLISEIINFSTIEHGLIACGKMAFQLLIEGRLDQIKIPYRFIER